MNVNNSHTSSNRGTSDGVDENVQSYSSCKQKIPKTDVNIAPVREYESRSGMISITKNLDLISFADGDPDRHRDECPVCFIPLQQAIKAGRGLAIMGCCETMLCKVCHGAAMNEYKRGNLKYDCIFGPLCNDE